jgi:hypothetical protein
MPLKCITYVIARAGPTYLVPDSVYNNNIIKKTKFFHFIT